MLKAAAEEGDGEGGIDPEEDVAVFFLSLC